MTGRLDACSAVPASAGELHLPRSRTRRCLQTACKALPEALFVLEERLIVVRETCCLRGSRFCNFSLPIMCLIPTAASAARSAITGGCFPTLGGLHCRMVVIDSDILRIASNNAERAMAIGIQVAETAKL